jgi:hypothetical protein
VKKLAIISIVSFFAILTIYGIIGEESPRHFYYGEVVKVLKKAFVSKYID